MARVFRIVCLCWVILLPAGGKGQSSWPFAPPAPTVTQEHRVVVAIKRGGVVTDIKVDTLAIRTAYIYPKEEEVIAAIRKKHKWRRRDFVLIDWRFIRYKWKK